MAARAFDTPIADDGASLTGPWRAPQQMLAAQVYDGHVSIHDDAMAKKMGFKAATIEGPTHFSQFAPLCERLWGEAWFENGCISAHYRNAVFAGEEVQAIAAKPKVGESQVDIRMVKRDGTEVLRGTASVGPPTAPTALDRRLRDELKPFADPVILHDVKVGMKTPRQTVRMDFDQNMGELYPFSLRNKLKVITEPSAFYEPERAAENKWGRAIIPFEMLSVLLQYSSRQDRLPIKGRRSGCSPTRRSGSAPARCSSARATISSAKWSRSAPAAEPRACGCAPRSLTGTQTAAWRRCCSTSPASRNRSPDTRKSTRGSTADAPPLRPLCAWARSSQSSPAPRQWRWRASGR